MKAELRAGATINFLSPEEHHAEMELVRDELRALQNPPLITNASATVETTAAGLLGGGFNGEGAPIYRCPAGFVALVHRVSIAAAAFTPATPYAAGWIGWYRNGPSITSQLMITPAGSTAVIPFVYTEGEDSAAILRRGEAITFAGEGLPASTRIGISLQIRLRATTEFGEHD